MLSTDDKCTILLVDDDEMLVELLTFKLEQIGVTVLSSEDGEEGLAMALFNGKKRVGQNDQERV